MSLWAIGLVCGWCFGVVPFFLVLGDFFNKLIEDCFLCLQGSNLLYEVELPGPPAVLALSNGNGGNKTLNIHIINNTIVLYFKDFVACLC